MIFESLTSMGLIVLMAMGIALFSHMTRNVLQLHITCTIYKWNRMCGQHSCRLTIDV